MYIDDNINNCTSNSISSFSYLILCNFSFIWSGEDNYNYSDCCQGGATLYAASNIIIALLGTAACVELSIVINYLTSLT